MTRIASGVADQGFYFVAVDATDFTTRETGLATWTVYRERNNGTAAAMTTPTITEVDATNLPGVYFLLCDEDTTIDAGDETQEQVYHITHAGMAPVSKVVELYRPKITAGNTLDVTSTGEAGLDFANVAIPDGPVPALGIVEGGTAQSATSTTLVGRASGAVADDAFNGCILQVLGSTQGYWQTVLITDTTLATDTFTVAAWPAATPSGTITYRIFGTPASQLTGTQTFNMVGNITGNLSGSVGSVTGAVGSVTGAVGSVTGNVGGNVAGSVASVTGLTASDVGAIKTKTDSLTFTQAGHVDANIQRINDVAITGNGGVGTEFSV